jgi:hypothetical protein
MRELAKSAIGFSLAMSLFGMEQLRNALKKKNEGEHKEDWIRDDLESVTEATGKRFSERTQRVFDAGDRFQREIIDLALDIFKSDDIKPKRMADLAADVAEKSAEALRDAVKDADAEDTKPADRAEKETA